MDKVTNSAGKIYYGMHFYPGVAQYDEPGKQPKLVFVNEDTIRKMDPTFAAKPIFVEHVEEVEKDVNELRKEVDGWVIESFFNSADGKHWVKFIAVTTEAEKAIASGFRLSNAYFPILNGKKGTWNGVSYQEEVVGGEYEHLAIVKNPRYDESVIMTPEQFKAYNENLQIELKRIANSKEQETPMSKLKFWNRKEVEKPADLESLSVTLPKTGKEMTIVALVNAMDEVEEKKKENVADEGMKVKLHDGTMCNVAELVEKHKNLSDEHAALKAKHENKDMGEEELMPEEVPLDVEGDLHNEDEMEEKKENEDEEKDEKKKENEEAKPAKEAKEPKKLNAAAARKEHFDKLKNAHLKEQAKPQTFDSSGDQVARGKTRYGSTH